MALSGHGVHFQNLPAVMQHHCSLISCSISMSTLAVDECILDIHMTSNAGPAPYPDRLVLICMV